MKTLPFINPKQEVRKIVNFLKTIQKKTGINRVVIGLSGGLDSTTVYYLLKKAYKPENIIGVSLPYETIKPFVNVILTLSETKWKNLAKRNLRSLWSLDPSVVPPLAGLPQDDKGGEKIRLGNIIARIRMIILFDLAKKHNALVCGTENKSERLLGYFTRFGDAASDIEPISHLYKTQIYQLAKYLKVPKEIINKKPTAGLWPGQTDEGEFGFTYQEADHVLHRLFDKKIPTLSVILNPSTSLRVNSAKNLKKLGYKNADKIIERVLANQFKQEVPYTLRDV
jgi:NAD+ synthase